MATVATAEAARLAQLANRTESLTDVRRDLRARFNLQTSSTVKFRRADGMADQASAHQTRI
jgi:hypothetical protein